ncbi:hypothetical protein [Geminocystis sp. GBBB08]|uniref:hypothetical protein n=1 Tax=Geminocystis sp. GBBB08 TaxID=2604140 RepID=UPI0027E2E7C4|nr:hypothetical protein [Geminocystis sp. GBBB08]MBL1210665.1 hypothetical protein [Geminocystis sp. GBBB08]
MDKNKLFVVKLSDLKERFDPNYLKTFKLFNNVLNQTKYPLKYFRQYINNIQYGISSLANSENKGLPILRMNNLQDNERN